MSTEMSKARKLFFAKTERQQLRIIKWVKYAVMTKISILPDRCEAQSQAFWPIPSIKVSHCKGVHALSCKYNLPLRNFIRSLTFRRLSSISMYVRNADQAFAMVLKKVGDIALRICYGS
uniref:Transposase n=1 Tax=Strongyloides papillosus TaxID=174720 RepID=A0A0N5C5M6_STREA